jgi:hypothetical protein
MSDKCRGAVAAYAVHAHELRLAAGAYEERPRDPVWLAGLMTGWALLAYVVC